MKAGYWRAFPLMQEGLEEVLSFKVCFELEGQWPSHLLLSLSRQLIQWNGIQYRVVWEEIDKQGKKSSHRDHLSGQQDQHQASKTSIRPGLIGPQ